MEELPGKRRAWFRAAVWAVSGVLVGAVGMVLLLGPRKEMRPLPPHQYRLAVGTSEQAAIYLSGAAISPDGRRVAYALGDGVWVQDLDKLEPRRIHDTEGAVRPFWSPDSASVGFLIHQTHAPKNSRIRGRSPDDLRRSRDRYRRRIVGTEGMSLQLGRWLGCTGGWGAV